MFCVLCFGGARAISIIATCLTGFLFAPLAIQFAQNCAAFVDCQRDEAQNREMPKSSIARMHNQHLFSFAWVDKAHHRVGDRSTAFVMATYDTDTGAACLVYSASHAAYMYVKGHMWCTLSNENSFRVG